MTERTTSAIEVARLHDIPETSSTFNSLAYCAFLIALSATTFGAAATAAKYVYKDVLGLSPHALSVATFIWETPWYLGCAFGILRDRWTPFGTNDRWMLVVASLVAAGCGLACGFMSPSTVRLTAGLILLTASGVVCNAVLLGQVAVVSKTAGFTGRAGAAMNVLPFFVYAAIAALTGVLMDHGGFRVVSLASAAISLTPILAVLVGRRSPIPVFKMAQSQVPEVLPGMGAMLRRLLCRREVRLVTLMGALWCFTPGWGTPLFYHFTNTLKLSITQFETTRSIEDIANGLMAVSYLFLCLRFPLRKLLFAGIGFGLGGMVAFLFVKDFKSAVIVSAWFGGTCGVGNAAMFDLILRMTPRHLEAAATLLVLAAMRFFINASDLIGSVLYERGGFTLAVAVSTLATICILPLIALLPSGLTSRKDGGRGGS